MKRMSVLMAVAFVDMIGLMLVLPLLPLYAKNLQADPITIGFLTASFPVAQLMASPIWGRVSDRYGRRPALLVGMTASAIAYAVFGLPRPSGCCSCRASSRVSVAAPPAWPKRTSRIRLRPTNGPRPWAGCPPPRASVW